MSLDDQQISARGHGTHPNGVLENVNTLSVVQDRTFAGLDATYLGFVYPFNPLNYPNLLADTCLPHYPKRSPPSPQFAFNPLDYPNLLSDNQLLQDPQTIISGPEFVFNPLDYPSVPPDSHGGNFETVIHMASLPAF